MWWHRSQTQRLSQTHNLRGQVSRNYQKMRNVKKMDDIKSRMEGQRERSTGDWTYPKRTWSVPHWKQEISYSW